MEVTTPRCATASLIQISSQSRPAGCTTTQSALSLCSSLLHPVALLIGYWDYDRVHKQYSELTIKMNMIKKCKVTISTQPSAGSSLPPPPPATVSWSRTAWPVWRLVCSQACRSAFPDMLEERKPLLARWWWSSMEALSTLVRPLCFQPWRTSHLRSGACPPGLCLRRWRVQTRELIPSDAINTKITFTLLELFPILKWLQNCAQIKRSIVKDTNNLSRILLLNHQMLWTSTSFALKL